MTGDIVLRDVIADDLPIFFEQQLDPEATRMAAFPSRDWEPFLKHWTKILGDDSLVKQTILFGGKVAGNIVVFGPADEREVGYWLGKPYWGKGIATRALEALLLGVTDRPLYAQVAKHNAASVRVLQKCGFRIVGEESGVDVGGIIADELTLKLGGDDMVPAERETDAVTRRLFS